MRISIAEAEELATRALAAAGTSSANAAHVARALVAAESDGQAGHGLGRVASYAEQAEAGKVRGDATPIVDVVGSAALLIDAADGFAYPAIALGMPRAIALARANGIAAMGVTNSHHFGMAGFHVETPARAGIVALAFGNSPAAIAPWGGKRGIFGTNPIAFACPRGGDAPPIVIDLSLSKVARGKIMVAAQRDEKIPEGWALDASGRPTTDAKAALAGTMIPMGEAKGAQLVLMVELLAAALVGAQFGYEASSFFDAKGGPPRVGQFFILIDPQRFAGAAFAARVEALCAAILAEPGTRLPGERRIKLRERAMRDGIEVPDALLADLRRRAG
jgi:(2R)-3-sulfolactate dehydrogenase (NADP+)